MGSRASLLALLAFCGGGWSFQPRKRVFLPLQILHGPRSSCAPPMAAPHRGANTRRGAGATKMDEVPQEIVDAESRATPGRATRIGACGVGSALAFASAASHVTALVGSISLDAVIPTPLFDSLYVSVGVEGALGLGCLVVIKNELETRDANRRRIWEEVQRRREGSGDVPRDERRSRSKAQKREQKKAKRRRQKNRGGTAIPTQGQLAAAKREEDGGKDVRVDGGNALERVIALAERTLPEANAIARSQAIAMNAKLEDAGFLEKVSASGGEEGVGQSTSTGTGAEATAVAIVEADDVGISLGDEDGSAGAGSTKNGRQGNG